MSVAVALAYFYQGRTNNLHETIELLPTILAQIIGSRDERFQYVDVLQMFLYSEHGLEYALFFVKWCFTVSVSDPSTLSPAILQLLHASVATLLEANPETLHEILQDHICSSNQLVARLLADPHLKNIASCFPDALKAAPVLQLFLDAMSALADSNPSPETALNSAMHAPICLATTSPEEIARWEVMNCLADKFPCAFLSLAALLLAHPDLRSTRTGPMFVAASAELGEKVSIRGSEEKESVFAMPGQTPWWSSVVFAQQSVVGWGESGTRNIWPTKDTNGSNTNKEVFLKERACTWNLAKETGAALNLPYSGTTTAGERSPKEAAADGPGI
jgi:hypothetical protein